MDVTAVSELYGPWTTLFTPCVDLGLPKKQDFVLKKFKKIKKGKSNPPQKRGKRKEKKS